MKSVTNAAKLVNLTEAANLVGHSPWTLRSWAYSGRIASYKISSRLMFSLADLEVIVSKGRRPALDSTGKRDHHAA